MHLTHTVLHQWPPVPMTVLTLPCATCLLFLVDDMLYAPLHYLLHHPVAYRHVHKHHHRTRVPVRGYVDAANEHPVEQAAALLLHGLAVAIVARTPTGMHAAAPFVHLSCKALLACLNHSGLDVRVLGHATTRAHVDHHLHPTHNFAQCLPWWDRLAGTEWKRKSPAEEEGSAVRVTYRSHEPQPHSARRAHILATHPEIRAWMGHDWRSKYVCALGLMGPQLFLAWATQDLAWPAYVLVAYAVGATLTQALFLAVHELSHNLFFASTYANRKFALLVNVPLVVPFCAAFRTYHLAHHKALGEDGMDTDVPSAWEARLVGTSRVRKMVWLAAQIIAYALRPMLVKPEKITWAHVENASVQLAANAVLVYLWGWRPLGYLLFCILLSGGLHPCAGHFVSEHYVMAAHTATATPPQETYSYYGPLNRLTWNVGYHNEHHDFSNVPWSRLPRVKAAAPEWYDVLEVCPSWPGALWNFVVRDGVTLYSRVTRVPK